MIQLVHTGALLQRNHRENTLRPPMQEGKGN
jgi:hypothetical protein